jgi:hypothetical protein
LVAAAQVGGDTVWIEVGHCGWREEEFAGNCSREPVIRECEHQEHMGRLGEKPTVQFL